MHSTTLHPASQLFRWRMGLLLIVLALLASILIQPAQALPVDVRALPQLLNEASANPHATFRVTIQRINGNRNADRAVKANGGSKVREIGCRCLRRQRAGRGGRGPGA